MAIIKAINSRASIAHAINYIMRKEKTEEKLIGVFNCNPHTAIEEMKDTKLAWNKTGGRQYKHFIQSFPREEIISLTEANQIASEFIKSCKLFDGYEVCYATHKDRDHVHTHIIVNSVSFVHGRKFHQSKQDLQSMKDLSDDILKSHGKSICEKGQQVTAFHIGTYRSIEKAVQGKYKSWVYGTMTAIYEAYQTSTDRDSFISRLKEQGIAVIWQDNRKYIIFTDAKGNKIRDKTLSKVFKVDISKEALLDGFKRDDGKTREATSRSTRQDTQRFGCTGRVFSDGSVDELRQHYNQITRIGRSGYEKLQTRDNESDKRDNLRSAKSSNEQRTATGDNEVRASRSRKRDGWER